MCKEAALETQEGIIGASNRLADWISAKSQSLMSAALAMAAVAPLPAIFCFAFGDGLPLQVAYSISSAACNRYDVIHYVAGPSMRMPR